MTGNITGSGSGSGTYDPSCTYSYIRDGYCDDVNNNARCAYDGGDCCAQSVGGPVKKDYCKQCKCLDSSPKGPACGQEEYKGDGNCDDDNNNAGCDFDGGDCCAKSLGSPVKTTYCNKVVSLFIALRTIIICQS